MPPKPPTDTIVLDSYDAKYDEDEDELLVEVTDEDGKKVAIKMDAEQAEELVLELFQILGLDEGKDDDD